jgi:transposase InsO family protein
MCIGISKQGYHQWLERRIKAQSEQKQLLLIIHQLRQQHPTMGCRDMYYKLQPKTMGRDAFEAFCREENLMVTRIKNWRRTTDSSGVVRFDNLTESIQLTAINQLWQSDITYFELNNKFYYITFILDAFSRRIVGHHCSRSLSTETTTLPALKMAIALRSQNNLKGLIFHSDGGGQYYDKAFLKLTAQHQIKNSMCEYAWENGKAERINGVIKNNYLIHRDIKHFEQLIKEVDRSVLLYNSDKPHIALQRKAPIVFENEYYCYAKKSEEEKGAHKAPFTSKENKVLNKLNIKNHSLTKTVNTI